MLKTSSFGEKSPGLRNICALVVSLGFQSTIIGSVYASGPGTGAANFLEIPVGARETSLGGAFTAVADNANAVYYNPAGLGLLQTPEVSFAHNKYFEGISQQWLSAAYPYKTGAFGLGVNYLSVSEVDAFDAADNAAGSVSAYDMAVYLSWGGRLWEEPRSRYLIRGEPPKFIRSVYYGASLKYIAERLDTETVAGYSLDIGCLAATAVENLRFGFGVENALSSRLKFIEDGARPPLKLKAGAMYEISPVSESSARFSLDYVFRNDRPGYLSAGAETNFHSLFSVRMGYSTFGDIINSLTFGLGFDLSRYTGGNISVDYSFGATSAFDDIHKLGVTYKFGRPPEPIFRPEMTAAAAGADVVPAPVQVPAPAAPAPTPVTRPPQRAPFDYYIDMLNSGSLSQRRSVVAALVERGGKDSYSLLLALLKDAEPLIVLDAVSALSGFTDPQVIEPLIELFDIKNVNIRLAAIAGLSRYKDKRVFEALKERLWDRSPQVRSRAAAVLRGMKNER